jgi:hypothetical protein
LLVNFPQQRYRKIFPPNSLLTQIVKRDEQRDEAEGLTAGRFVVVHVDALQLQVGVAAVRARGVDAMLVADHLWGRKKKGGEGDDQISKKIPLWGRGAAVDLLFPFPGLPPALRLTHLPELGTDLVTALASLDVDDFAVGRQGGRGCASVVASSRGGSSQKQK